MIPYRRVAKRWLKPPGAWLLGWAMFYYLPVAHADGIRLKAWEITFAPADNQWPLGTRPFGGIFLYPNGGNFQTSWIIDVTNY